MNKQCQLESGRFSLTRKIAWLFVPVIAIGGIFYPQLGFAVVAIMVTILLLGFLNGLYWCGNICPHGSLFDFILTRFSRNKKIPGFFRSPVLKWGFFLFFMAMVTFQLSNAWGLVGEAGFAARLGTIFANQYLIWPSIVGVSLALVVSPRTWCSFCPMGTMQQLANSLGKKLGLNWQTEAYVNIKNAEECKLCGRCERACPVQLKPQLGWEEGQFRDPECIKCQTCVNNCPAGLLQLSKPLLSDDHSTDDFSPERVNQAAKK